MIGRQMAAAIQMVRLAIAACPEDLWDDRSQGSPFWHLAYHALFYADLYLSKDQKSFQPASFRTEKAQFLPGDYGKIAGFVGTPLVCYSRDELLAYADHCLGKCESTFATLTDAGALERCGFWWYELNVGEFLLNNLRHAQHHAGQLALILRRRADIGVEWRGTRDNEPPEPTW